MATQTLEFSYSTGKTLTADVYPLGLDTADSTANACTENTNSKGRYTFTVSGASGAKLVIIKRTGTPVLTHIYDLADTTSRFFPRSEQSWATASALIGGGSVQFTLTVDDGTDPLEGVACWITTDLAGTNVVAGTLYTDTSGQVTFMLDPGTYYFWKQLGGFDFTNPQTITVS